VRNKRRFPGCGWLALTLLLSLALVLGGCGKGAPKQKAGEDTTRPDIGAEPAGPEKITLYFGDNQAMYLVPEEREVAKGNRTLEEVIIAELIKGPTKPGSTRTIPEGTKLISVSVVDGVAYVNFSKEFQTKHWGGSAGEMMTIYSVVNSLAKLEGIEKVQFLLEGKKQESILGHMDTTQPIAPDWKLVKA